MIRRPFIWFYGSFLTSCSGCLLPIAAVMLVAAGTGNIITHRYIVAGFSLIAAGISLIIVIALAMVFSSTANDERPNDHDWG